MEKKLKQFLFAKIDENQLIGQIAHYKSQFQLQTIRRINAENKLRMLRGTGGEDTKRLNYLLKRLAVKPVVMHILDYKIHNRVDIDAAMALELCNSKK